MPSSVLIHKSNLTRARRARWRTPWVIPPKPPGSNLVFHYGFGPRRALLDLFMHLLWRVPICGQIFEPPSNAQAFILAPPGLDLLRCASVSNDDDVKRSPTRSMFLNVGNDLGKVSGFETDCSLFFDGNYAVPSCSSAEGPLVRP